MSERENPRHRMTSYGKVYFTEEEELARDAEEQAWADGANDRLAATHRATRNQLLADSDWTQFSDSPLTDEAKTSWATYRSSLRSLPEHENWPSLEEADWPTKPS
tara:strand:- start:12 stop:326 length:315 start_codon:yes stop_codon:yes gene_type:complete